MPLSLPIVRTRLRFRSRHASAAALAALALAAIAACSGSDGSTGPAGPAGTNGSNGSAGTAGATGAAGPTGAQGPAGTAGGSADGGLNFVVLSEVAQRGLQIAPVPLNLAGKTNAELEDIGVGSYMVNAVCDCSDCHSPAPNKYLAGGVTFPLDASGHTVTSRNLTSDSATGLKETEDQYVAANRNGTDFLNIGAALIFHPWQNHRWIAETDLRDIYRYLKTIPAINNTVAADNKSGVPAIAETYPSDYNEGAQERPYPPEKDPTGAFYPDPNHVLRGLAIIPLALTPPSDPQQLALLGRGAYLVNAAACNDCHTNPSRNFGSATQAINTPMYLGGGAVFPVPDPALYPILHVVRSMSANLVGQTHGFFRTATFDQFLTTITQGVHGDEAPGAQRPLSYPMPWPAFRQMTLSDLESIFFYMKYVATTSPTTGAGDKVTQPAARYCTNASTDCQSGETCDSTTHECVGRTCSTSDQCDACQECPSGSCVAPAANSTCLFTGR